PGCCASSASTRRPKAITNPPPEPNPGGTMSATTIDHASAVQLRVRPLSGAIGAVVEDLDVRHVDDATVAAIRQVWLSHKVVFFPAQHLDPDEHIAFARRFGEPTEGHPVIPGIDGHPEV